MDAFQFYLVDTVARETFLGYLKEWKESVDERTGFDKKEKAKMISRETIEGLKMAG